MVEYSKLCSMVCSMIYAMCCQCNMLCDCLGTFRMLFVTLAGQLNAFDVIHFMSRISDSFLSPSFTHLHAFFFYTHSFSFFLHNNICIISRTYSYFIIYFVLFVFCNVFLLGSICLQVFYCFEMRRLYILSHISS